ncbi:MAG: hypothetical protein Q7W45_13420 [Bacteroidota bacterium]|nr:hypothetical protein [Bacteroidota bacterium]MDP3144479.1 hypothetical protein [Bacteroidota bacterium]MDP3555843.1 hypothetical protein [Bacteroidota bacterium]
MTKNTAILVLSCDKYADAWRPFFLFFEKYWGDCPFPIYLGTNEKEFKFNNVKQIFSHKNTTWSDELQIILKQIPEKNIILILEDYFIYKQVNTETIIKLLEIMESENAAYLKLAAFPKKYDKLWPHNALTRHPNIGEIEKESQYRVCLQTAIWNKEILLNLLNPAENPWQFEIEASKRSNLLDNPILCVMADPNQQSVHGPIQYYCTALTAGKWMRGAVKLCKKENIALDLSQRLVETRYEELRRKLYISLPIGIRKVVDFLGNKAKTK